jgi:hypothetical protein
MKMNLLISHLKSLPNSALNISHSDVLLPDGLPESMVAFFRELQGGSFDEPPNRIELAVDLIRYNVNQCAWDSEFDHTYVEYDRCFLFARAKDSTGFETYRGISLNHQTYGWIFVYQSEGIGVSDHAFFIFKDFQSWLVNLICVQDQALKLDGIQYVEECPQVVLSRPIRRSRQELLIPQDFRSPII